MTNNIGQQTNNVGQSGLGQLFASPTLVALLRLFVLRPGQAFYQRQLAQAVGARLYLVQRELGRLENAGLVTRTPQGNRVYYRLKSRHPALDDLRRLLLKTVAIGDALRSVLLPLEERVLVAFIYGSFASGNETADSDIDLLVIGRLSAKEAARALGPVGRDLGRELNAAFYPPEEFRKKARDGHHFVSQVLAAPKVFLIGGEDELAGLAG